MKRGVRQNLQEQPLKVLAMLLERPGEVVSREELRDRVWTHTVIDFDHGINKAINKIRDVLGDSATHPRFVETVARRGYRFLAEVTALDMASPKPAAAIRSIAVLPLEDLSGDSAQDYFADGMTDELIMSLGQISALRVISRTSVMSYKLVRKPLPEIARELAVEAVVEGTVMRSGTRIRIAAHLIEAPADKRIWTKSYEEDFRDTINLQHRVARHIAEQVRATLSRREQAHLESGKAIEPTAYEAYLRGRYFWNKRTEDGLRKAIACFNEAIEADPTYAQAYAGLADSYALSGDWQHGMLAPKDALPKAKAAADRALALDGSLGEAHASLAFALDLYFWDWSAAEAEYKRAIALNPSYATAHQWYAWHLIATGRNHEAIDALRKASSLDPLSLIIGADLADALCIAHLHEDSIEQSRKILEMDPNFSLGHYQLGQALAQLKSYDQAIAEFRTAIALATDRPVFASNLAHALAQSGREQEARHIVKELVARQSQHSPSHSNIALAYVGLGDHKEAMVWLEKALQSRFHPAILARPAFDPLRYDPRFQELLRRLGLPQGG
ncbi:MAG: tetratricopeptide repeat protein [Hyphomicrobiales bacterium]|nr:tetratricopeptide repeat protein [Hyphomicrobiales bacterium]